MKIIFNNIIPFKGFSAITLFGLIFVRKGIKLSEKLICHESIHVKQQRELLWIFFFIFYLIEWVIRVFISIFKPSNAYRSISFEREAYDNEKKYNYTNERKSYAWFKYIFKGNV